MSNLYRHYDKDGRLLYVGVSDNPDKRLKKHRYASRWSALIERMEVQKFESLKGALEAEKTAIKEEQPLYNTHHGSPIDKADRPKLGGLGRGQGRKPVKVGEDTVTMSIRMTPAQREKVAQLGGAGWVRDRIDGAPDPVNA
jgi:predicted GIY-YIG superfamily endonuclease